jgi:hypothetical protein
VGVEYSPLAHFVGNTKLAWHRLDVQRLRERVLPRAIDYQLVEGLSRPGLAAFQNPEIFRPAVVDELLSIRKHLAKCAFTSDERSFLLLGLAAITEEVSRAMKDGRALRILRTRKRSPRFWTSEVLTHRPGRLSMVRKAVEGQWLRMVQDLEVYAENRKRASRGTAHHARGDSRGLSNLRGSDGKRLLAPNSVGLILYSPPYLNCVDYSEIYKIELWLLEFIRTQEEFRELRLGTLRSHPSIQFPARDTLKTLRHLPVVEHIYGLSDFIMRSHNEARIGRMVLEYFEDMYRVLLEQFRVCEPGAHVVCIVANSTFSGRLGTRAGLEEVWRVPVFTDVLLARLGEAVGFHEPEIWKARELRPRNVQDGSARESLVILRKPR